MLIDGICVPLTAPFYRDGSSYLKKLEHNVHRYSLTPVTALVALIPGGEGAGLSDTEVVDTLRTVGSTAAPGKVLIAGISSQSVLEALRVAGEAEAAGFDALLVAVPAGLTRAESLVHVRTIADRAALPVMLWSAGMDADLVGELAWHANVMGAFDTGLAAEGRYQALVAATDGVKHEVVVTTTFRPVTRRMKAPVSDGPATFVAAEALGGGVAVAVSPPVASLKTRTKTVGFQILAAGRVEAMAELLAAGVAGILPDLAASAPQVVHEVYAAFKDGDPALAALKNERVLAADALLAELGVAGVKYGCDWNGYYGGAPRLPRLPLDGAQREQVERVLAGLRN